MGEYKNVTLTPKLTAGTLTETSVANVLTEIHRYSWTNTMVVALGASAAGDITVCTLPAKTVVRNAYVVITGTMAGSRRTFPTGSSAVLSGEY